MKALVKLQSGKGNIALLDVKEKRVDIDDIKIEVVSAGICGTDLHILHDEVPYVAPVILGHEFSGKIVDLGKNVRGFSIGNRVTAEPSTGTCRRCPYCRDGNYNLCSQRKGLGRIVDGAFAGHVVIDKSLVHRIPDEVDYVAAALCEPLSVGVHALAKCSSISTGSKVVVRGPGIIGIFVMILAIAKGAEVVVLGIGKDAQRLEIARNFGARESLNVESDDYIGEINKLTVGYGADVLFECSGSVRSPEDYVNLVRKQGEIVQLGVPSQPVCLDLTQLLFKEIKLIGSFSQNWQDFEDALELLRKGQIPIENLAITELPLEEWKRAFDCAEEGEYLKVVLNNLV